MSFLPTPIVCNVCGTPKKSTNHWFYCWARSGHFQLLRWDRDAEDSTNREISHLCGQVCVVKKLSEWMEQQTTAGVAVTSTEAATGSQAKD